MVRFVVRFGLFLVVLLVALEVLFRTLLPATVMPYGEQDVEAGIMKHETGVRDGVHGIGRYSHPRFHWHINDDGWNSAWEYRGPDERDVPCVAVVGNSYVQGLYSDVEDHLAGRLQHRLDGRAEVYNLGTSGMPLSQSRRVVRHARDAYAPSAYVILAGFSSLKASIRDLGFVPLSEQLEVDGDGFREVGPSRQSVSPKRRLASKSAIVRYLYHNANLDLGGGGQVVKARNEGPAVDHSELYLRAARHVLGGLRADDPDADFVIVVDADRNAMYDTGEKPSRLPSSDILEQVCAEFGMAFVDMTDAFWTDYEAHGRLLNFPDNYHWNPYAVDLVARTVLDEVGPGFPPGPESVVGSAR